MTPHSNTDNIEIRAAASDSEPSTRPSDGSVTEPLGNRNGQTSTVTYDPARTRITVTRGQPGHLDEQLPSLGYRLVNEATDGRLWAIDTADLACATGARDCRLVCGNGGGPELVRVLSARAGKDQSEDCRSGSRH